MPGAPMPYEAILSRSPSPIGQKIHILTGRSDRPAIDHPAVSKSRVTANRSGLRECQRTCQGERCSKPNRLKFHGHFLISKPHQQIADRVLCSAPAALQRNLRRRPVIRPARPCGRLHALGLFQLAAQIPRRPQGQLNVGIVDVVFKEDDDFAARALPGVAGLHAACPVPEITPASLAVDCD
jgi:hypothetical protein